MASKSTDLIPRSKGNLILEALIAAMVALLIWTLVDSYNERQQHKIHVSITRAKMKTLRDIEFRYLFVDTGYTADRAKLTEFALGADTIVHDTLFAPLWKAYQKIEELKPTLEKMSISDFRRQYVDSLFLNSLTGQPFLIEIITEGGRKTFNIKPSHDERDIKDVGAIIEGEVVWDEKRENEE